MLRVFRSISILFMMLSAGCAGSLAVRDAAIQPDALSVGQEALLTVTFTRKADQIASVVAYVREAQEMTFGLVNDGTYGDETAGDDTWSLSVPVPPDAPAGTYHLDILAKDADGQTVFRQDALDDTSYYSASVALVVR